MSPTGCMRYQRSYALYNDAQYITTILQPCCACDSCNALMHYNQLLKFAVTVTPKKSNYLLFLTVFGRACPPYILFVSI